MSNILLVEDDKVLGDSIKECLESEGFCVHLASHLKGGQEELKKETPDLVILDWMLPDGQGIELLRDLSGKEDAPPVIMLTARSDLIDKVLGLEMGASDYLTKPFEPRELIARIRVQLRRPGRENHSNDEENSSVLKQGGIEMNLVGMQVHYGGELVQLTKMEFSLLKLFLESPGQVFSRDEILDSVWGMKYPTTRTVDVHVKQLRQKFKPELFETVHGTGYRFKGQI